MKTVIFYGLLIIGITSSFAQSAQKVNTQTIKIEEFISHTVEDQAYDSPQILYLLAEVGPNGFNASEIFHIQQGLKLLSKRLPENSLVALGTYGSNAKLVAPFTKSDQLEDISKVLSQDSLFSDKVLIDGIDLAFQTTSKYPDATLQKTVLILRNNKTIEEISNVAETASKPTASPKNAEKLNIASKQKLGGAIALTALSILPEVLDIIKD